MDTQDVSHDDFEGGFPHCCAWPGIEGVLSQQQPSVPVILMVVNEDS